MRDLDIIDIKSKVKNKELKFYLLNGNIYCKNLKSDENIIVGSYPKIELDIRRMIIRENGISRILFSTDPNL